MTEFSFTAHSKEDTIKFAQKCAKCAQANDIFTLQGPMGAGKSEFARGFIRALMQDNDLDVPSPTFTLAQTYDATLSTIWHFDLYRLNDVEEIYEIGWEEALSDGIILVEWPDRLEGLLPAIRKEIIIEPSTNESRKITMFHHQNEDQT